MDLSRRTRDDDIAERFFARRDAVDKDNHAALTDNHSPTTRIGNGFIAEKARYQLGLRRREVESVVHRMRAVVKQWTGTRVSNGPHIPHRPVIDHLFQPAVMGQEAACVIYSQAAPVCLAGFDHLLSPFNTDSERLFHHNHLNPRFCSLNDRLVMMEVMGGHAHDVQICFLVHLLRGAITVLGCNFPFIAELLQAFKVNIGYSRQLNLLTSSIAAGMRVVSSTKSPDTASTNDTNPNLRF